MKHDGTIVCMSLPSALSNCFDVLTMRKAYEIQRIFQGPHSASMMVVKKDDAGHHVGGDAGSFRKQCLNIPKASLHCGW